MTLDEDDVRLIRTLIGDVLIRVAKVEEAVKQFRLPEPRGVTCDHIPNPYAPFGARGDLDFSWFKTKCST